MKPRLILSFWLGSLDSRVAAGKPDVGGTHDIRFGWVGQEVRQFLGREPDSVGRWAVRLEPYPEARCAQYDLIIAEYRGAREGECALPAQHGSNSPDAYPLWRKVVRPYASGRPKDAIVLIQDTGGRFHARVVHREHLPKLPKWFRDNFVNLEERGQLIAAPHGYELIDIPWVSRDDITLYVRRALDDKDKLVAKIKKMRGSAGRTTVSRHQRSRQLAEELKRLYQFQCQLCDGTIPRIHVSGDRYYVEVHHIEGFAEVDTKRGAIGSTQDNSDLLLDRADNIVVVCPHHHMVLHYGHGGMIYDSTSQTFVGGDGTVLPLLRNEHL